MKTGPENRARPVAVAGQQPPGSQLLSGSMLYLRSGERATSSSCHLVSLSAFPHEEDVAEDSDKTRP